MEQFKSKMVKVTNGSAAMLSPVSFSGKLSEAKLEELLIANPELAGEPFLSSARSSPSSPRTRIAWTCSPSTARARSFSSS